MADNFPLEEVVTEKIAEDNDWPSSRIHPYEAISDRETSGMAGHSQKMGIKLSCIYEENIYVPAAEIRWFESASEAVLFHLTKMPVENAEFIAVEDADSEEDNGQPWGQTLKLQERIDKDLLLDVAIDGDTPGMLTLIPRTVQILIPYWSQPDPAGAKSLP